MTTLDLLYSKNVEESREADIVWAAKQAIQSSDQDNVFKKYFLSKLESWDPSAIELCKTYYTDQSDKDIPDWNCNVCGCSDRVDIHGDRICGCDSCSKTGCETTESRVARGCKRRRELHEIGLAFDTLISLFSLSESQRHTEEAAKGRSDMMRLILRTIPPPSLETIFDDVQGAMKKNNVDIPTLTRIYNFICWGAKYTPFDDVVYNER
jgi:hypothetical protein